MPYQLLRKPPFGWATLAVVATLAVLTLASLRYLEQSFAQAGLWLFMGLTLTTGFFHGALDIVLIQREFVGLRRRAVVVLMYVAAAVVLAMVCAYSGWLMVLILLLMSVWHFGEPYERWAPTRWAQGAWMHRFMAGGAPVMLPALLSAQSLQAVLPIAVGQDAAWAWSIWQTLAWLWVGLCGLGLAVSRQHLFSKPVWTEVAVVFVINLVLSPLMAFSIYFGVLHSATHIFRIATRCRHSLTTEQGDAGYRAVNQRIGIAIVITSLATVLLLLALAWYLHGAPLAATEHHHLLGLVLVALTAVTLPHLVLVSRNAHWLTAQSPSSPIKV